MSFVARSYPDIVRDVLTGLTQGVTGEVHRVDYDPATRPVVVPDIVLARRPVRRVSMVQGVVAPAREGDAPVARLFSLDDYELIANPDDPSDLSRIRFRPFARARPAPGTDVTVNYYPRTTDPTPLTDLNVGSVTRTLVEAVSREVAALYAQLNIAYDSGFVETATGPSLDRVVALLSYARFKAGRAVGSVVFTRRTGATGSITIPAGTPITDTGDTLRYVTSERYDMLAGESTAEVRIQGETAATAVVADGVLTVVQRAIAGIDAVSNPRPTARATEDESDEALRARARDALLAANKGTVEAIRHGLLALPSVKDVAIEEFPNGVAGEIRVSVQLASGPAEALPPEVSERIEALRPAGIRMIPVQAEAAVLAARVALVLAGSSLPAAEIEAVQRSVRERLVAEVGKRAVGERVRVKPLVAALLADARIVDATVLLGRKGGAPGADDFVPGPGEGTSLSAEDIAFDAAGYAAPPPADAEKVTVEVTGLFGVTSVAGTPLEAIRAELGQRLSAYTAALTPGRSIDAATLLQGLGNDARYALDPLKLRVTLTARDEFVEICQGGQAYAVRPGQSFVVAGVELAG